MRLHNIPGLFFITSLSLPGTLGLKITIFSVKILLFELEEIRVGNSLFGFSSESLVFCERKSKIAIRSWKRVNCSRSSFVKSDGIELLTVALL